MVEGGESGARKAGGAGGLGCGWHGRMVPSGLFAKQVDLCTVDLLLSQMGLILRWFGLKNQVGCLNVWRLMALVVGPVPSLEHQ